MTKPALKKQSILPRLDGIQHNLEELRKLTLLSLQELGEERNFLLAQTYLRLSIEGVFHIGAHILSRIPGGRATEYKEIARQLGKTGIVPQDFAETALVKIAGYRHRLTHFYAEITVSEIHDILKNRLADFDRFMTSVQALLKEPEKFDLRVE